MQLSWSHVVEFIARRNAVLASSFIGVGQSEIDAVQAQCGIGLPSTYLDFLRTMGESSGELFPFGETYNHTFSELIELLPPEDYPAERFFKVAFQAPQFAVDAIDLYLDLARSDGHDAPLVMCETPVEPADPSFLEYHFTIGERLVDRIFRKCELEPTKYGADIMLLGNDPWKGISTKQAAMHLLTQSGFSAALPELRRIGCLTRESASVLITVADEQEIVEFELGGDTREAIERPVRELLVAFPDADLETPPSERSGES